MGFKASLRAILIASAALLGSEPARGQSTVELGFEGPATLSGPAERGIASRLRRGPAEVAVLHARAFTGPRSPRSPRAERGRHHFPKMKNDAATMSPKPTAWFQRMLSPR